MVKSKSNLAFLASSVYEFMSAQTASARALFSMISMRVRAGYIGYLSAQRMNSLNAFELFERTCELRCMCELR